MFEIIGMWLLLAVAFWIVICILEKLFFKKKKRKLRIYEISGTLYASYQHPSEFINSTNI